MKAYPSQKKPGLLVWVVRGITVAALVGMLGASWAHRQVRIVRTRSIVR